MKLLSFVSLLLFSPLALAAGGVSIDGLIHLVIWLVVIGLIFWLLFYFIGYVGLPEPFAKVARVLIMLLAVVILLYLLLGMLGPLPSLR